LYGHSLEAKDVTTENHVFTNTKPMFGLENITHWQFAKVISLCIIGYYLIILFYLALKKIHNEEKVSFESEALQSKGTIQTKAIKAADFPSSPTSYIEQDENDLKVSMDKEPDHSGYEMDALQSTEMQDKEAFLNNIEYELQQH